MTDELKQLEDRLWEVADKVRSDSALKSTQYSTPQLRLIFLHFAWNKSDIFKDEIEAEFLASQDSLSPKTTAFFSQAKCLIMADFYEVTDNRIWHEFCVTFSYNKRIRVYIDRCKKWKRRVNWAVIIISTVSALIYWKDTKFGAFFSAVTDIALVAKELWSIFNQSETDLLELSKGATFFSAYQTKMEQLLMKHRYEHCHPAFWGSDFFKLKEEASQYVTITNEYYRGLSKIIETKLTLN